jgi:hypothetical protein
MASNDKYDRQLRLWGANGQKALMNAKILLINADSVGTETLKNLVLPGLGTFTILDDSLVTQNDLECNFFVDVNSLAKPRAQVQFYLFCNQSVRKSTFSLFYFIYFILIQVVVDLLCEMNSDVKGIANIANYNDLIQLGTV